MGPDGRKMPGMLFRLSQDTTLNYVWNVTAQAQKPVFVFRWNGRVHLNRQGRQFSRLLAAEVCSSEVVMLDVWRVLATYSIRQFPLHFPYRASPCAIAFQLDSTTFLWTIVDGVSFTFHLRIIFRGNFYVSKTRTLRAPVTNGPVNMIQTPITAKIIQAGPITLSSMIRMCIKLDLSSLRGDHTHGIFNNKVLAGILGLDKPEETEEKLK